MQSSDPYIAPETGILRNLVGAKNLAELHEREANISAVGELLTDTISRTNDFVELSAIHKTLFGPVYDWAGKKRTVNIRRGNGDYFLDYSNLDTGLNFVFSSLAERNNLVGLKRDDFIQQITYFYEQLNYVHPFREGNGRAQRLFWTRVARDAGYRIDWSQVIGNELDEASRVAREEDNMGPLIEMFKRIVI